MDFPQLAPIIKHLEDGLGEALIALYLVGSGAAGHYMPGRSDLNLFLVLEDDTPLEQVQKLFHAQWSVWAKDLKTPPVVACKTAFLRHLQLKPALNMHIQQEAQLLSGQFIAPYPRYDRLEVLATYCTAALNASPALGVNLPDGEKNQPAYNQLHRLARRLIHQPIPSEATPRQLFIIIQRELKAQLAQIRGDKPVPRVATTNLEAVYHKSTIVVLIIPEMSEQELAALDWSTIAGALKSQNQGIGVTTPWQFRLSLLIDEPIDYALHRYERQWGRDILEDHPISRAQIYRALARDASNLLVNVLPQHYLITLYNEEKYRVIHDLQNRLLNLHLQAELLHRIHGFPFSIPSIKVPGRETQVDQRIAALVSRLDYWVTYYIDASEQATVD